MGLLHRKILEEVCTLYCQLKDSSCSSTDCLICIKHCESDPPIDSLSPPSPPIYIDQDYHNPTKHHKIGTFLAVAIAVLTAAFFVLLCYAIYARFLSGYLRRRRRTTSTSPETEDNPPGDFVDEEQGPMVDHPIWYIRTPGLQQSIISAITVCKYKKGEGLIEGTECSVCLSEFEEDENLRLLPKCNHAFHLPCIDTWLRSHTNCPMCRAPIVTNPATIVASPEPNVANLSNTEGTEMEVVENGSENEENREEDRGRQMVVEDKSESEGSGSGSGEELENLQPRRRSVSLDSSSVEKINRALAFAATNVASVESSASKRVSKSRSSSFRIRSLQNVAGTSMKRSRSYNGKHLLACYGRSQRKPNLPIRSF